MSIIEKKFDQYPKSNYNLNPYTNMKQKSLKHQEKDCKKECKEDEVCNRSTGRCVKKTSITGRKVLENKTNETELSSFQKEDWDILSMPKDHHCGYHAFLYGLRSVFENHPSLSFDLSLKNLILHLKFILLNHYKEKSKIDYDKIIENSNVWLDDKDLSILAEYFQVCIYTYDERIENNILKENNVFTKITPFHEKKCHKKIFLYQTIGHFDVMFPKNFHRKDVPNHHSVIISDEEFHHFLVEKGLLQSLEPEEDTPESETENENMDYEEYTDSKKPFFIVKSKKIKKKGNIPNVLSNEQISSKLSEKIKKSDLPDWLQ